MGDPKNEEHVKRSRNLIEEAEAEHGSILRQLEQSHDTIARTRKIITLLEEIINAAKKK
jgi:anti-sigma factor ChrR (cupin superfamily)